MSDLEYTVQPITDYSIFTTPASQRKPIQFKASWSDTTTELGYELAKLGGRDVTIEIGVSANDIRLDGQLRANAQPGHPGVRISFQTRKHGALSYTCDTYERAYSWQMPSWQANVRAIVKTLESLRAVDRYGATKGEQYAGFKALGAGTGGTALGAETAMTKHAARDVIGAWARMGVFEAAESVQGQRAFYKRARANAHPDRNDGDRSGWNQVEQAAKVLGLTQ